MNNDIVLSQEDFQSLMHDLLHPNTEYLKLRDKVFEEIQKTVIIKERNGTDTVVEFPNLKLKL